jgi:uncharacterized protein YndB with AHSA1/START domain
MSDLSPISFEYRLACSQGEAFDTYAGRIGEWWDGRYTANAETFESVTIEPGVGGRVYESHAGGGEYEWGEVTVWEPGRRLVHSFALAQDPANPSEVAVEFDAEGDGSVIRFEHRGWIEANVADRKKFGDWPVLLDRFAALAEAESS